MIVDYSIIMVSSTDRIIATLQYNIVILYTYRLVYIILYYTQIYVIIVMYPASRYFVYQNNGQISDEV